MFSRSAFPSFVIILLLIAKALAAPVDATDAASTSDGTTVSTIEPDISALNTTDIMFAKAASVDLAKSPTYSGKMTWFYPGLGNCGYYDDSNDAVVALPKPSKYQNGKNCNKKVRIWANGRSTTGKIRDSCPGCGSDDLDVSPVIFKKLVPKGLDQGVQKITWQIL